MDICFLTWVYIAKNGVWKETRFALAGPHATPACNLSPELLESKCENPSARSVQNRFDFLHIIWEPVDGNAPCNLDVMWSMLGLEHYWEFGDNEGSVVIRSYMMSYQLCTFWTRLKTYICISSIYVYSVWWHTTSLREISCDLITQPLSQRPIQGTKAFVLHRLLHQLDQVIYLIGSHRSNAQHFPRFVSSSWSFASQNLWDPTALRAVASFHVVSLRSSMLHPNFTNAGRWSPIWDCLLWEFSQSNSVLHRPAGVLVPKHFPHHGKTSRFVRTWYLGCAPNSKWHRLEPIQMKSCQHMLLNISYAAKCC